MRIRPTNLKPGTAEAPVTAIRVRCTGGNTGKGRSIADMIGDLSMLLTAEESNHTAEAAAQLGLANWDPSNSPVVE